MGARALQPLSKLALLWAGRQPDAIAAAADSLVAEVRKAEPQLGLLLPSTADAAAVRAAFPRLAENAYLILDPDLDSYYLADLTLLRMPGLYEALRREPAGPLNAAALEAVRHAVSTALEENRRNHPGGSSLATRLPPALAAFEIAASGASRLQAAAALWQTGIAELSVLLEQRAAALRRKELTALVLTLASVALAVLMLSVVVRNVSVPLARATRIADKIAAGRLDSAAQSLSRPDMQRYAGPAIAAVVGSAARAAGHLAATQPSGPSRTSARHAKSPSSRSRRQSSSTPRRPGARSRSDSTAQRFRVSWVT